MKLIQTDEHHTGFQDSGMPWTRYTFAESESSPVWERITMDVPGHGRKARTQLDFLVIAMRSVPVE